MKNLTLALDWTPNINHIGFFIALKKGFYKDIGISLNIIDPSDDNYAVTPAKKVELGEANFALCPTESILSYRTKPNPFPLIAIAAILQEDLSAIVVKERSDLNSPKDLDGKSYASYNARYEDEIVRQMIQNDGGKGKIEVIYPEKLGIWDTLLSGEFDSTWVFLNWEGVEAENCSESLHYLKMKDYNIPYSYSPMLVADERTVESELETYRNFLAATKKGFLFAAINQEESIEILTKVLPKKDLKINLEKALRLSSPAFGDEASWGKIEKKIVSTFLNWIYEKGLERVKIPIDQLITNKLLS